MDKNGGWMIHITPPDVSRGEMAFKRARLYALQKYRDLVANEAF